MLVRFGALVLWIVGYGAQAAGVFDDYPGCASFGVSHDNNMVEDCKAKCSPFQATTFDQLNTTNDYIAQVYMCECGGTDDGCRDEIILIDRTIPIPTCDDNGLNIASIQECREVCDLAGLPLDTSLSRDVNGKIKCFCQKDWPICSDDPTCGQLQIFPGTVESDCEELCPSGAFVTFADEIEFRGDGANKNQTHLNVACSCGDIEQCRDNILFSDYAFLKSCRENLNIKNEMGCEDYCVGNGFTEGFEYLYEEGFLNANCTCKHIAGEVLACEDVPTPEGGVDVVTSGSGSFNATWIGMILMSIVVLLWS